MADGDKRYEELDSISEFSRKMYTDTDKYVSAFGYERSKVGFEDKDNAFTVDSLSKEIEGIESGSAVNNDTKNAVPQATPEGLEITTATMNRGLQSQGASLTRKSVNHFFGRTSLNINKAYQMTTLLIKYIKEALKKNGDIWESRFKYHEGDLVLCKNGTEKTYTLYRCIDEDAVESMPPDINDAESMKKWEVVSGLNAEKPIGFQYVQYPRKASNNNFRFHMSDSPQELFGGTWQEVYSSSDKLFFCNKSQALDSDFVMESSQIKIGDLANMKLKGNFNHTHGSNNLTGSSGEHRHNVETYSVVFNPNGNAYQILSGTSTNATRPGSNDTFEIGQLPTENRGELMIRQNRYDIASTIGDSYAWVKKGFALGKGYDDTTPFPQKLVNGGYSGYTFAAKTNGAHTHTIAEKQLDASNALSVNTNITTGMTETRPNNVAIKVWQRIS